MKNAVILSLMLAAGSSWADHHDKGEKGETGACKADVERFCTDVKPGDGRIIECLMSHEKELSESCRAAKRIVRADMKDKMMDACQADAQTLCPGKELGTGLGVCLKENKEKVSEGCRAAFGEMREKRKEWKSEKMEGRAKHKMGIPEACQGDAQTHCAGKEPGKGLWICIKENKDKLSASCAGMMKNKMEHKEGKKNQP